MRGLVGTNMTNFFNREMFMYSLGDIKFSKPVSLKKMAYTTGFLLIWTFPMVMIFGLSVNVWFALIALVPPFVAANLCVKPIFGGKNLIEFIRTMYKFAQEPKAWSDLRKNSTMGKDVFFVEQEIWISRRRELAMLEEIRQRNIEVEGQRKTMKRQREALKKASRNIEKVAA